MNEFFAYLIIGSIFVVLIFFLHLKNIEIDGLKTQFNTVTKRNVLLCEEIKQLKSIIDIKDNNRRESDEKINNLHSGSVIDNAINILRNNENGTKNNCS